VSVLKKGGRKIAQVLLNDQSSRECAYDNHITPCDLNKLGTAGWSRVTTNGIEYVEHEFGVVYEDQVFSYWPGFSLNPGLWDLERMKQRLGEKIVFGESDDRFEQSFSLMCYDAGLIFAHLPKVNFRHIGTEVSSYVLQGDDMMRPWD